MTSRIVLYADPGKLLTTDGEKGSKQAFLAVGDNGEDYQELPEEAFRRVEEEEEL